VSDKASPAARLCTGVRLYLRAARQFPLFARFLARLGPTVMGPDSLINKYVPRDLEAGMASGEFARLPALAALDLVVGSALMAVTRVAENQADDDYLGAALKAMLRGLGLAEEKVKALVAAPLEPLVLDADTLFMRSDARFQSGRRRRRA